MPEATNKNLPMPTGEPIAAEQPVAVKSAAPQGVIQSAAKMYVLLGIAVVILLATAISSLHKQESKPKPSPAAVVAQQPDTSQITDFQKRLKQQIAEHEQQKLPQTSTAAQEPLQNGYGASLPNDGRATQQPYNPAAGNGNASSAANSQPDAEEQQRQALAAQEREMSFKSRFASNLAFSASHADPQPTPAQQAFANLAQTTGPQQSAQTDAQKRTAEVSVNSALGQPYVLYEGTIIDTVLMNRLDGDESWPVKVLVSNPVYSHDRQHILIPEGSVILGESRKIGQAGFGQQRRMALVFHRMLMPDGYSVDLDRFQGLNQIGETGIKDKANNHYLEIFGASIALGIVGGAAEVSAGNSGAFATGTDALKSGIGASLSQSGTNILDKFLNIPPTITIREGHRIKVYISQDLLLPAVENHTIPPNI